MIEFQQHPDLRKEAGPIKSIWVASGDNALLLFVTEMGSVQCGITLDFESALRFADEVRRQASREPGQ